MPFARDAEVGEAHGRTRQTALRTPAGGTQLGILATPKRPVHAHGSPCVDYGPDRPAQPPLRKPDPEALGYNTTLRPSREIHRIAVTAGGTAGHILPALEFLDVCRNELGTQGYLIGCGALERRLAQSRGWRFELIPGRPWARQKWLGKVHALACLPGAVLAARRILMREGSELVIGAGGYASFSTCVAACTLGVPVVIHESNARPGLANRILSRIAAAICVGCEEALPHFRRKAVVTGVPSGDIGQATSLDGPPWRFLVLGGSEGSPLLNREAPRMFAELSKSGLRFSVRHLAGFSEKTEIERAYFAGGVLARVEGFVESMAPLYAEASMVFTSAGARTLAELAAAGLPAFIVPLPGAAHDHQVANARLYAARTGAPVIWEESWDCAAIATHVMAILSNPEELRAIATGAASWRRPDAARQVARVCERVLGQQHQITMPVLNDAPEPH